MVPGAGSAAAFVSATWPVRKLLANPQGSRDNGTVIIQWQDDGGPEQEWVFEPPLEPGR